ncbi:hypothetical protein BGZ96_007360 [Linnemannia gamsii]|uniref:Eisosome component PIL1-domain-containing protein n=1 Tax=Linnemannia gamsii TaxID=64522 RepID=A0ABQ7K0M2_9FUNG|nr:hypothetical protein BGZ96_007360 [Linnemannia gamsii]
MDLLNLPHLQESARRAAGSFLSPLTNAISEQRRLVDSLAVVSKVRVEECKHMMVWSKSQTEDIGDVLLKLNLLIRKISDYEIRFGTQYESFREKIKYLRTKDDSLCEMGRRQADLQQKLLDASKSRLRSAKARLLQTELDDLQKESAPTETKLQALKRQCIKGAYTEQLNAIIELGKKMQIIGEHGKELLDHIDTPGSTHDGRKTEDILQAARITLENWDQLVMVNPQSVVVHPPPPPPRSQTGLSVSSINSVSTVNSLANLSVSGSEVSSDSDSDSDSDIEFVAAPSSPLKAKASVAVTTSSGDEPTSPKKAKHQSSIKSKKSSSSTKSKAPASPVEEVVTAAAVAAVVEPSEPSESSDSSVSSSDEEELEVIEVPPKKDLLTPFASTLAPKLTLTPNKLKPSPSRATIPTESESDWASEATQALASIQIKKAEELKKQADGVASDSETLKRLEELEIKHALELSLAESKAAKEAEAAATSGDLQLTAEEIRFVMGDVAPKRSTRIAKRQARAPETVDGDSDAVITRRLHRLSKKVSVNTTQTASASHTETEDSEEDLETPKATHPPRIRGPQLTVEPEGPRISQQGPRPWMPENEEQQKDTGAQEDKSSSSSDESDAREELASKPAIGETMGEQHAAPKKAKSIIRESLGREPELPLESMGPEPEKPLESMGPEPEVTLESMGPDGPEEEEQPVNFVAMPQMPALDLDAIRQQKLQAKQQQKQYQQQQQYEQQQYEQQQYEQQQYELQQQQYQQQQQLYNSPQPMNQQVQPHGTPQSSNASLYAPSPSTAYAQLSNYQSPSYKPATKYVPSTPKQKKENRLSGSHSSSPSASPQMQNQQFQGSQQSGTYSAQYQQQMQQQQQQYYKQQQQQLQDFYYSSYEQEYQNQQYQAYQQQLRHQRVDSVSSVSSTNSTQSSLAPLGWNLPGMAPPQVTEDDIRRYKDQHQQHQQHQQQQQQYQQQHLSHERPGSAAGSVHGGDDSMSSGAPSPSPSHISLVPDLTPSPVMASVAPLVLQPKRSPSPLAPNPDDYKVEVKET